MNERSCPWKTTRGDCYTTDCAEFGPWGRREPLARSARTVALVRGLVADGELVPGDEVTIVGQSECPIHVLQAIASILYRDTLGARADLSIRRGVVTLSIR